MSKWNADADQKLLFLIISGVKIDFDDVSSRWAAEFPDSTFKPTARAVSEHVSKLKKQVTGAVGSAKTKSTPAFSKGNKGVSNTPKTPKTPSSAKRQRAMSSEDDDDEKDIKPKFQALSKLNIPVRRPVAQRKEYNLDSDNEGIAAPKQEPSNGKAFAGTVGETSAHSFGFGNDRRPSLLAREGKSVSRNNKSMGLFSVKRDPEDSDEFMP